MSDHPKFFKKEGKYLRPVNIPTVDASILYSKKNESISSIFESVISQDTATTLSGLKKPTEIYFDKLKSFASGVPTARFAAFGVAAAIIFVFGITAKATILSSKYEPNDSGKFQIYSSKPLTRNKSQNEIRTKDSRAQKVDGILRAYDCPLEGLGSKFVEEADKYNIPWWLVASVSFKESSCGKYTPQVDGKDSYNAWGWGVYGGKVSTFDNWARGIERVSKYFSDTFYTRGVTDLCEIMKTYTPPSNGSWCEDVQHFSDQFQGYQTSL